MTPAPVRDYVHVVIIGGGPVGLFLGACLCHRGISCMVLDRRRDARVRGHAVGIHLDGLRRLEQMGLSAAVVEQGHPVARGRAYRNGRAAGVVDFTRQTPPFPFLLTTRLSDLERILLDHLRKKHPEVVRRGVSLSAVETLPKGKGNSIMVKERQGPPARLTCAFVIGCDGRNSAIRQATGIGFDEEAEPTALVMGDFVDDPALREEARVYLDRQGLIESIPLPGGLRRWMLQTEHLLEHPDETAFFRDIRARTGFDLRGHGTGLLSSLESRRYVARTLFKDRSILVAEPAYAINPIASRGLNLSWTLAGMLADVLQRLLAEEASIPSALAAYEANVRARLEAVERQIDPFLAPGRRRPTPWGGLSRSLAMWKAPGNLAAAFYGPPPR